MDECEHKIFDIDPEFYLTCPECGLVVVEWDYPLDMLAK